MKISQILIIASIFGASLQGNATFNGCNWLFVPKTLPTSNCAYCIPTTGVCGCQSGFYGAIC